MKVCIFIIFFYVSAVSVFSQNLSGFVKNIDGEPSKDVSIIGSGYEKTDLSGFFKIKNFKSGVLYFTRPGFKPIIKFIEKPGENLQIVLAEESSKDRLKLFECSEKSRGKKLGVDLILLVPKNTESKKSFDVDYSTFFIAFGKKENRVWLQGWSGSNATSGHPDDDWIKSSVEMQGRSIINEKGFVGWDWFGKTKDGKNWRYIHILSDSIFYITDNSEAKLFFDNILDRSCTNLNRYSK